MGFSFKQFFPFLLSDQSTESDSTLNNREKIIKLLKRVCETRTLLKVTVPGSKEHFTSCILDVDEMGGKIVMDKLIPLLGHELLTTNRFLSIEAKMSGATLSFDTKLIRYHYSKDDEQYDVQIPSSINYHQRRENYRVQIRSTHQVKMRAAHPNNEQLIQGKVHDICLNGIGIISTFGEQIEKGDELKCCKLQLSDDEHLNFTLEVRHVRLISPGTYRIGGNFKDFDQRSSQIMSRFVREMERRTISN